MNLVIIKDKLREAIFSVSKIVNEQQKLPILKNVLLNAYDNKIVLTTTNLEIAITFEIPCNVISKGKTTIPVSILENIIQNIQSEMLNLESNGTTLELQTDNYKAKIQCMSYEDFPIIPKIKNNEFIEFDGFVLKDALNQVLAATQFSELRPELNNIYFSFNLETLVLVGTDSSRLAEKIISPQEIKVKNSREFNFLLPIKTAHECLRIIPDADTVKIFKDQNQVLFKTQNTEIISRLSDGSFPDYKKIIPTEFKAKIDLDKNEFLNALKLTGSLNKKSSDVRIRAGSKKNFEIFSEDNSVGENKYILQAKIQGEIDEISFNWRYLTDGIKSLSSENVFFGINESTKPALLKSSGDLSYFYITMPLISP